MEVNEAFTYLLITAIMLFLLHVKDYLRAIFLAFSLPGPPALPILGNALIVNDNRKMENLANTAYDLYGSIFRCWISIVPFFFITEPEHIQTVFGNNKNSQKNGFYSLLHNFLGEGLITSRGHKWKRNRKILQPCFHTKVLEMFFKSFYECTIELVDKLRKEETVNVTHFVNQYVLDVLYETVMGSPKHQHIDSSPFRKGKLLLPYRIAKPWLLMDFIFSTTREATSEFEQKNNLRDFTKRVLENKRNMNCVNENVNLMSLMIEIADNNPEFSDEDIVNETCTFMLAGQDSAGAAIAFTLFFLAKYQDVQSKVVEELNNIYVKDNNKVPTFEDINEMKYLEQCIKEAMRLCPSVPILTRQLTKEIWLGKCHLPAGCNIMMSPFLTHRLRHIFPDPMKYDPDRFSSENLTKLHTYAYLPFSGGPRNCIGNRYAIIEMKTVISELLRNFKISLSPGYDEYNLSYRITLRASGGIWLKFESRQS